MPLRRRSRSAPLPAGRDGGPGSRPHPGPAPARIPVRLPPPIPVRLPAGERRCGSAAAGSDRQRETCGETRWRRLRSRLEPPLGAPGCGRGDRFAVAELNLRGRCELPVPRLGSGLSGLGAGLSGLGAGCVLRARAGSRARGTGTSPASPTGLRSWQQQPSAAAEMVRLVRDFSSPAGVLGESVILNSNWFGRVFLFCSLFFPFLYREGRTRGRNLRHGAGGDPPAGTGTALARFHPGDRVLWG